ncbi:hypothetical protein QBC35DRAFT_113094 [Podospora australis]|uniref:Uncharacterized protein n=1 Tax=Podospora australis TaxID=1536484 RepID=A0AAN7AEY8_9PEZI|nr:hypothetical protein QBC35DRAFT_113094 [Podospora australis]
MIAAIRIIIAALAAASTAASSSSVSHSVVTVGPNIQQLASGTSNPIRTVVTFNSNRIEVLAAEEHDVPKVVEKLHELCAGPLAADYPEICEHLGDVSWLPSIQPAADIELTTASLHPLIHSSIPKQTELASPKQRKPASPKQRKPASSKQRKPVPSKQRKPASSKQRKPASSVAPSALSPSPSTSPLTSAKLSLNPTVTATVSVSTIVEVTKIVSVPTTIENENTIFMPTTVEIENNTTLSMTARHTISFDKPMDVTDTTLTTSYARSWRSMQLYPSISWFRSAIPASGCTQTVPTFKKITDFSMSTVYASTMLMTKPLDCTCPNIMVVHVGGPGIVIDPKTTITLPEVLTETKLSCVGEPATAG